MISETELYQLYNIEQKTCKEISLLFGCGQSTVKRLLKKYHIQSNLTKRSCLNKISKDFLIKEYVHNGKSMIEIAEEFNLSRSRISRAITRYNIPKRIGTRLGKTNKKAQSKHCSIRGHRFGKLIVKESARGGWLCVCDCGNQIITHTRRLTHDGVKSCGCLRKLHGNMHHLWKGCGEISMSLFKKYYSHALDRGLEFTVSINYLWNIFLEQNKLCAISKQPITFNKQNPTASLDRIDSSQGYVEGNVQWLHKTVNTMKWNLNQNSFINLCKVIAEAN